MATVTLSLPTLDHLQAAKRETISRPSSLEQYSLPFHPLHKDIPPGVTVGLEGDQPPDRLDGSSSCQVGERWSLQHREDRLGDSIYVTVQHVTGQVVSVQHITGQDVTVKHVTGQDVTGLVKGEPATSSRRRKVLPPSVLNIFDSASSRRQKPRGETVNTWSWEDL